MTIDPQTEADVDTVADRAGLRERIAAAIWERQNPGRRWADCEYRWRADAEEDADAVLSVLPPDADRGAVLRELEERYRGHARDSVHPDFRGAYSAVANDLSRMADEQQPGTTAFSPGEGVHGRDPYYASSDTQAQQQADTRCGPVPDQCDAESGEPCAKHEREQAHTEGDHTFCGPECAAACTCGVAGDCFVPAGHYADCPCPEARQQHGPAPAPVAVQPPADTTGEEAQPRFVRACTPCPQCDHTLDEDGACANGCTPPAVVAEPGKEN